MSDLSIRIMRALDLAKPEDYEPLHPHTSWQVCQLLEELRPSELSAVESMALAVILSMAHARKLAAAPPPLTGHEGDADRAARLNFMRDKGWLPAVPAPALHVVAETREDVAG